MLISICGFEMNINLGNQLQYLFKFQFHFLYKLNNKSMIDIEVWNDTMTLCMFRIINYFAKCWYQFVILKWILILEISYNICLNCNLIPQKHKSLITTLRLILVFEKKQWYCVYIKLLITLLDVDINLWFWNEY